MSPDVIVPLAVAALGVVAAVVSGRLHQRTADRPAALAELEAALGEQRVQIDRYKADRTEDRVRIDALEDEVQRCEAGRAEDNRRHTAEAADLRSEVRRLAAVVEGMRP